MRVWPATVTASLTNTAPSILIEDLFAALRPSETGIRSLSLNPAARNSFRDHKQDIAHVSSLAITFKLLGICGQGLEKSE